MLLFGFHSVEQRLSYFAKDWQKMICQFVQTHLIQSYRGFQNHFHFCSNRWNPSYKTMQSSWIQDFNRLKTRFYLRKLIKVYWVTDVTAIILSDLAPQYKLKILRSDILTVMAYLLRNDSGDRSCLPMYWREFYWHFTVTIRTDPPKATAELS